MTIDRTSLILEMHQRTPVSKRNLGTFQQRVLRQAVKTRRKMSGEGDQEAQQHIAKLTAPAKWETYKKRVERGEVKHEEPWGPYRKPPHSQSPRVRNYESLVKRFGADEIERRQDAARERDQNRKMEKVFRRHLNRAGGINQAKIQGR